MGSSMRTQGKVSMVVPCYNKVEYIGAMLESVIAQRWDNIELILVNDGSTDGTREIIAKYEPKLKVRGYEVVIVDQENAGCCAAVYAGLIRMTGDYFCLVDCDDELYPEYVSKMAGFLEENREYDFAACQHNRVLHQDGKRIITPPYEHRYTLVEGVENYILYDVPTAVWIYMVRIDYLKKIKLIENFNTQRNRSYEPLFAIPYLANGGKLKVFSESLYYFNVFANELSNTESISSVREYINDKKRQFEWAIERLDKPEGYKNRLLRLVEGTTYYSVAQHASNLPEKCQESEDSIDEYIGWIRQSFSPSTKLERRDLAVGITNSWRLLSDVIMRRARYYELANSIERIVCYGVHGKRAQSMYPMIKRVADEMLKPVLYWDLNAADGSELFGNSATVPDFNMLTEKDLVLIFPKADEVFDFVTEHKGEATALSSDETWKYLFYICFGKGNKIEFKWEKISC